MEWSPVDKEVTMYINSQTYKRGLTLEEVEKLVNMIEVDFGEVEQDEQDVMDDLEWLRKLDENIDDLLEKKFNKKLNFLKKMQTFANKMKEAEI